MKLKVDEFGVDLTEQARCGRLDPVVGRDPVIARLIRILARKTKNNPVLLGEPGVGKTAVVEGLAQRIVAGEVPAELADVTVWSLNLGSLIAGTAYRGDFEKRLQELTQELRRPGSKRLLFVDELHLLGKVGKSEGGIDAGNLLKPLLARGQLPCIGASTPAEWREMVGRDPALERRFQPVDVPEPSAEQTLAILHGLRRRYEQHHGVEITDEALEAAVARSITTMPDRRLPDKAVDLLDEACAMLRLSHRLQPSPEFAAAQRDLAIAQHTFNFAAYARVKHKVLPSLRPVSRPRLEPAAIAQVGL